MSDQARAFDVAQKARAQAHARVRAFDQAGQIGDDERAARRRVRARRRRKRRPGCGSSVVNG